MDNLESWKAFESSGRIEDYLKYAKEKKLTDAYENFISAVERQENDGRNDNSSGDSYISDVYK